MLSKQLSFLTESEQKLLLDSVPYVTVLIAGADGNIDTNEREWAEKITNIRSYQMQSDLTEFYEKVGENFKTRIDEIISELSSDTEKRQKTIVETLSKLSPILNKMEVDFSTSLLDSLKSFAKHVAESSGGFLDYASIGINEYQLIDLPMIDYNPRLNERGL